MDVTRHKRARIVLLSMWNRIPVGRRRNITILCCIRLARSVCQSLKKQAITEWPFQMRLGGSLWNLLVLQMILQTVLSVLGLTFALQDSSRAQTLKKQLDLKELFRIVQKDVETECMSDEQVIPRTFSGFPDMMLEFDKRKNRIWEVFCWVSCRTRQTMCQLNLFANPSQKKLKSFGVNSPGAKQLLLFWYVSYKLLNDWGI